MLARLGFGRLRTQLLVGFLALAVAPLTAGGLLVYRQAKASLTEHDFERLRAVADLKAEQLRLWLAERQADVENLAAIPGFARRVAKLTGQAHPMRKDTARETHGFLASIHAAAEFTELFVLDGKTGEVLVSTDHEQEGKFQTDRPYFNQTPKERRRQHVFYSLTHARPVVSFSTPVVDGAGAPRALLVGLADLRFLDAVMEQRGGLGATGRTFVVNRFNYFVSSSLGRGPHGWRPVFSTGVAEALRGQTGVGLYTNHEGRQVVAAYRWLPDLELALIAEIDEGEAFAPIRRLRFALIAAIGLVSGIAILLGSVLAFSVTRPIHRVAQTARAIGQGDLTQRLEVRRPAELAGLATAFNRMTDDLVAARREVDLHTEQLEQRVAERTAESEARRGAAEALAEVGRTISQSLDLDQVCRRIAESMRAMLGAQHSVLLERLPTGDLVVIAESGDPGALLGTGVVFPAGASVVGLAAWQQQPVTTPNLLLDPRINLPPEIRAHIERRLYRAILAVPLVSKDTVIGSLGIGDVAGRVFTSEDVRLARAFAAQAAVALENARLYQRAEARARRLETLGRITRLIASASRAEEVFEAVADAALTLLGAKIAYMWTEDPEDHVLRPRVRRARDPRVEELVRERGLAAIRPGEGVVGAVFSSRTAEYIADVNADPRLISKELTETLDVRAVAVVPLIAGAGVVGVLSIAWNGGHQFGAEQEELIRSLADHAAIAVRNAELLEGLRGRQEHLETLLELGRELSRLQPLESLLQRIAEACAGLLGTDSVGLRIIENDELVVAATTGDAAEVMSVPRLKVGESLTGIVAATGEPLVVADLANDARLVPAHRPAVLRRGHRAWLGVPVLVGHRLVGVLSVRTRDPKGFSSVDVELAAAFAAQAAVALENARLYREAQQAYEELSRTQEQLVQAQKMEAVGRLAGGIAHDFNNLLTVIIGRTAILTEQLGAGHAQSRHLELVHKTAKRAAGLTSQLLAFSRKRVLQPRVVDLDTLVADLAPMLRRLIGEDIDLVRVPGADMNRVKADPHQLEQVLLNLAVNARDAMPRGGCLKIQTASVDLDDEFVRGHPGACRGPHVKVAVSDTGHGMDAETMARIFEPFFTTKADGRGTGLGLATVYGIVHQHGGCVTVESTPDQGTTFTVYLPATADRDKPADDAPAARALRGTGTILLVEDDAEVRELASEVLQTQGYRVLTSISAEQAVQIAASHPGRIDLLLTDVVMPGISGPEVAAQAAAHCPDIRVLYMSGYTDDRIAPHAVLDRGDALLEKPFTPEALLEKVRERLGHANGTEPWPPSQPAPCQAS